MARVRQNDFGAIGRLLDMGALGIIVPMVHNAEIAKAAAFAMRYPPRGGRSGGAFGVGFHGGGEYMSWADDEVFLAVQIESAEGLNNAEEIMAVEGVDGCWVGPGDLGISWVSTGAPRKARRLTPKPSIRSSRPAGGPTRFPGYRWEAWR